ncbi:hypothetical protein [Halobacteriovorax sp.]|uniref:hypothetical protein n=1 Tax=Halobacteriovorax sp. TaxID=2020862 RepID=UPI003566887E
MKHTTILILLLISKITLSVELVRLSDTQREQLNRQFARATAPILGRLGSGDIVGNGSGLVEQNFMSAYYSIQTAIQNCLNSYECDIDTQENILLREINQVYIDKIGQERPLLFASKAIAGDFFKSEEDKSSRIAMTGFSSDSQIFINLDMAEKINNDIPAMISILVHELGHQVGIANHSILDQLGAKVRNMWSSNFKILKFVMRDTPLEVRLFSTETNYITSKLSYNFKGKTKGLNNLVFEKLECAPEESVYGFNLTNGHWRRPVESGYITKISIGYWVDIYCQDSFGNIRTEKKDLDVKFRFRSFHGLQTRFLSVKIKVD